MLSCWIELPYLQDWYRFVVLNNSNFNFRNFGLNTIELGDRIDPGGIETFSGDLSSFEARGGKFLTYHGRRDQVYLSYIIERKATHSVTLSAHRFWKLETNVQLDIADALHAFP